MALEQFALFVQSMFYLVDCHAHGRHLHAHDLHPLDFDHQQRRHLHLRLKQWEENKFFSEKMLVEISVFKDQVENSVRSQYTSINLTLPLTFLQI